MSVEAEPLDLWRRYRAGTLRLRDTAEYHAWRNMRQRCRSMHPVYYRAYRGRGIVVAPEFENFWTFLFHVGRKPSQWHSLDRRDNDRDYEYFNLRWSTGSEQAGNRRRRAA
jgi:hypothetical protein